jgi:hypothetical protein
MEPTAMLPQPAAFVADRASPVSGKPPIPHCILVGQTARSACGGIERPINVFARLSRLMFKDAGVVTSSLSRSHTSSRLCRQRCCSAAFALNP